MNGDCIIRQCTDDANGNACTSVSETIYRVVAVDERACNLLVMCNNRVLPNIGGKAFPIVIYSALCKTAETLYMKSRSLWGMRSAKLENSDHWT